VNGAVIGNIDIAVIIGYILLIVGIGIWAGMKKKISGDGSSYFLAGGILTWPIIGLALFSTNISTVHLVSLAQEGYINGLAYGAFEWMAIFTLLRFILNRKSLPCRIFLKNVIPIIQGIGWQCYQSYQQFLFI